MITTSFLNSINQQLNTLSLEDLFEVQFRVNMLILQNLYPLNQGEENLNYPTALLPNNYMTKFSFYQNSLPYPVYPALNNYSTQNSISVKKPRRLGLWRGKVKIASDFDEPLNEI